MAIYIHRFVQRQYSLDRDNSDQTTKNFSKLRVRDTKNDAQKKTQETKEAAQLLCAPCGLMRFLACLSLLQIYKRWVDFWGTVCVSADEIIPNTKKQTCCFFAWLIAYNRRDLSIDTKWRSMDEEE